MGDPVHLALPHAPPQPAQGCAVCAELAGLRRAARARGDLSAVTDADVEIRHHPHQARRR
ncbi:hypothetical protein [Streptomyces sp. WM6378]|uniref:hypothetical protein n=1 Tax=Streptomyces sp. WM6378 TaxID=1415557 RepID=UPI000D14B06E|nr:hypothetical protein [Streptomyces sp. WM6378]